MKADTTSYVTLQTLYRQKAQQDLLEFKNILQEILDQHQQILPAEHLGHLSDETVQTFVKHSAFLKLLRGRSLAEERQRPENLG